MKICECFGSIQGEGLMIGAPTFFVRTAGCNLECSWCDTGYSKSGGYEMTPQEILSASGDFPRVCVTGGEPMLQPETPELLKMFAESGKQAVLETNGSVNLSKVPADDLIMISMDIKCPSSGMSSRMDFGNLDLLTMKDQLKFVVRDDEDFDYALGVLRDHPVKTNIIFSPVGGTEKLDWLVSRVLKSGTDARVLPQLHKIIWGDRRGV